MAYQFRSNTGAFPSSSEIEQMNIFKVLQLQNIKISLQISKQNKFLEPKHTTQNKLAWQGHSSSFSFKHPSVTVSWHVHSTLNSENKHSWISVLADSSAVSSQCLPKYKTPSKQELSASPRSPF